jgi:3-isopropylmalate/(R)-2-methylmalate dehydratase small subunit
MDRFDRLTGIAAPLPMINVDTDKIIPKQFLKTIKRSGLARGLFYELRHDPSGALNADFVLHRPPYTGAQILIAGENFGCGSSREHAPWALLDFGIRCIVAPSFADIFFNNCFKNGIVAIVLPQDQVDTLMREAELGQSMTVDLPAQTITLADGRSLPFAIDPFRKACLVEGLDEIGLTLQKGPVIEAFESRQAAACPWLYD